MDERRRGEATEAALVERRGKPLLGPFFLSLAGAAYGIPRDERTLVLSSGCFARSLSLETLLLHVRF
jgi:hypothetical protein